MYIRNPARLHAMKGLLVLASLLTLLALAPRIAHADGQKPKETPTEVVVLTFGKVEYTYSIDGSRGPDVTVEARLHVGSRTLLSADGTPTGFTLHTNLSDAFASSLDGTKSYVAVGASDGIPGECQPAACFPPFWMLTFRLMPAGSSLQSSLLFDVMLKTQYAEDGTLLQACVVGEDGCDIGVGNP